MKNNLKWVSGLIVLAGLTWSFAGGTKAKAADKSVAEKNAITVAEDENCVKTSADCARHTDADSEKKSGANAQAAKATQEHSEAHCPKGADCPKDHNCAKPSMCHKPAVGETKSKDAAGAEVKPMALPKEEAKTKGHEAH